MRVTVVPIVIDALGTDMKKDYRNWKSEEESRLSRPQHCLDQQEYSEEIRRKLEETFCHSDSSLKTRKKGNIKKKNNRPPWSRKTPIPPKRNHPKQLLTNNVPTDHVENTISIN